MSEDIVERLREYSGDNGYYATMKEAADEIERLRAALSPAPAEGFNQPDPHTPQYPFPMRKFRIGDRVRKIKGSEWQGPVVDFYQTKLTLYGYAVESEREKGSVQVWPQAALELIEDPLQEMASADLSPAPAEGWRLGSVNPAAVDALANYQQADMDGIIVKVSRQAIEECLPALRAMIAAAPNKESEP